MSARRSGGSRDRGRAGQAARCYDAGMNRSWLIVGWALAGCASAVDGPIMGDSTEGTDVSMETSEAKGATHDSVPVRKTKKPEAKTDGFVLGDADRRGVALGSPCPSKDPNAQEAQRQQGGPDVCGSADRVSIEYSPVGLVMRQDGAKLPCEPQRIVEGGDNEVMTPYQSSACVADDFLIISDVCVMCRVMSGHAIHARISELSADQRKYVMQVLHLKEDAPADAEGFKKILAKHTH